MADEIETYDSSGNDFADQLISELDDAPSWPLPREMQARQQAAEGRALRKGDKDWLKMMHRWDADRDYIRDALPKRIAFGWADFLFAEEVTITAASDDDDTDRVGEGHAAAGSGDASREATQVEIDATVETNRMPALLHRAERIVVSEGEAYWKLHVNRAVADCALLDWCSRLDTIPLFYGERLLAAAFITTRRCQMEIYTPDEEDEQEVFYRHAEIHTDGRVINLLYRGLIDRLGERVPLDSITESAGYNPEWKHGLPMLAGRVVNDLDDDPTIGIGEFDAGVNDMLLALNEAVTISVENARLTGQDRVFAAGRFTQSDGSFDASMQVFQLEDDGGTLGEGDTRLPIVAIEKHYDAVPLWLHITNLVKTILSRTGLVPQWIGEDVQGAAETGVAIRLKFIPTTNAAKGKTREWGHEIPHIIDLMLRVASLPIEDGGFGRDVAQDEPPAVEFADPIPTDQSRDLMDVSSAVVSEVMSRRTAVKTLHPSWSDDQVEQEIALIDKDKAEGELPPLPPAIEPAHPSTH